MQWELVEDISCDNCFGSPLPCLLLLGEEGAYIAALCAECLVRMADHRSGFALLNVFRNIKAQKALRLPRAMKGAARMPRLEVMTDAPEG